MRKKLLAVISISVIAIILVVGSLLLIKNKPKADSLINSQQVKSIQTISQLIAQKKDYIIVLNKPSVLEQTSTLRKAVNLSPPQTRSQSSDAQNLKLQEANYNKELDSYQQSALLDIKSKLSPQTRSMSAQGTVKSTFKKSIDGIALSNVSRQDLENIKKSPFVKAIYPDQQATIMLNESVPLTQADQAWQLNPSGAACSGVNCLKGDGVTIAVIDSGIDYTHPDFGSCTKDQFIAKNCSKVVGGYNFVDNTNDPMDDEGHGTHVSSIAAGNGTVKGVAPNARILSYKVLNKNGSGSFSQIIQGIDASLDPNGDGDLSDHADVINLSIGGMMLDYNSDPLIQAVNSVADSGIVVVVAAGNSGPAPFTSSGSPSAALKAITVGATWDKNYTNFTMPCTPGEQTYFGTCGSNGQMNANYWGTDNPRVDTPVSFSAVGPTILGTIKPDVVAPGALICAARFDSIFPKGEHPYYYPCVDDKHVQLAGTSMASPMVAGAAALVKQKNPTWTPDDVKSVLRSTAKNIGSNNLTQGQGRINVLDAVKSSKYPVATLTNDSIWATSPLDIKGTASGDNFKKYRIYYGQGLIPTSWSLKYTGSQKKNNEVLYQISIPSSDKIFNIKLEVEDSTGKISRDQKVFYNGNLSLAGWPFKPSFDPYFGIAFVGSPRVDDMNGDGKKEITAAYTMDNYVYNWDSTGRIIKQWGKELFGSDTDLGFRTPIIADINNDNKKEIVINRAETGDIFALDSNGTLLNSWNIIKNKKGSTLALSDLNNDGKYELVVFGGAQGSRCNEGFSLYDMTGKLVGKTSFNINQELCDFDTSSMLGRYHRVEWQGVVSDIDGDNQKEIIISSGDLIKIYSFDGQSIKEKQSKVIPGSKYEDQIRSIVAGDINSDGKQEIIMNRYDYQTGVSRVYAFDNTGNLLAGWPKDLKFLANAIVLGDLDNDQKPEIVVSDYCNLYIFDQSGSQKATKPTECNKAIAIGSPPVIADINADGVQEIVNVRSAINLYDKNLNEIGQNLGFPLPLGNMPYSSPVIADINNDGKIELVITGLFDGGKVYVFSLGTKFDPNKTDWPTLNHDNFNTGSYGTSKPVNTLSQYDFNCDGKTDTNDINVLSDLWRNGTVINSVLVTQKTQTCKNLGDYLGNLLNSGKTGVPIEDVTRIASEIKRTTTQ